MVKHAKAEHQNLRAVFVDIAKAFDTICHWHILKGLKQRGVDPHLIHLIRETYENIITCIAIKEGKTDPIKILTGIKQGDRMSPVLFNLALDPLLRKLEQVGKGFHQGDLKITAMVFADDLMLLSDSWEGIEWNISLLETFL